MKTMATAPTLWVYVLCDPDEQVEIGRNADGGVEHRGQTSTGQIDVVRAPRLAERIGDGPRSRQKTSRGNHSTHDRLQPPGSDGSERMSDWTRHPLPFAPSCHRAFVIVCSHFLQSLAGAGAAGPATSTGPHRIHDFVSLYKSTCYEAHREALSLDFLPARS